MLDKRLGLVLGPELVTNGDFSNGTTGFTPGDSNSTLSVVNGQLVCNCGSTTNVFFRQTITTVAGRAYFIEMDIVALSNQGAIRFDINTLGIGETFKSTLGVRRTWFIATGSTTSIQLAGNTSNQTATVDNVSVRELPGNHAYTPAAASTARPTVSARVNLYLGTATLATQNVTTVATNYTLRFEGTGSVTLSGTATGTYSAGTHTITCTAGTLTTTVTGTVTNADIRPANDGVGLPVYQRVTTSSDYDVSGFPVYLRPDGSNDYMLTNSIDFSATDKMTLCAGVRKLSDAATGMLMELSASSSTNTNTFRMTGAILTLADYNFASSGSLTLSNAQVSVGAYPAPITNVLTGIGDISGDSAILRINGTQVASSTADQGTGNYGNYQIFLFMRAGTSLPFNGRFYGGVVRGAQSNDQQIAALEGYMNTKTAAY
jgi:hypothetical protein